MFESIGEDISFGAWVTQLLLAYTGPLLALGLLESVVHWADTPAATALQYLLIAILAVVLSLSVAFVFPNSSREGRWTWVLPAALELIVLLALYSHSLAQMRTLFYVPPGEGEAGWGIVLITLPTWSCCCYSGAMWYWRKRRNSDVPKPIHLERPVKRS